jgi:hypothetical protein
MKTAELLLAFASTGMQACLGLILLRRGLVQRFPIFFKYTSFAVISSLLGLAVRNNQPLYSAFFWTSEVVYSLLVFLSLQEIFRSVFQNFYNMRWFRLIFPGIGLLMVTIAGLRTALYPMQGTSWRGTLVISLEIATGFLQIGIFGVFVLLVRFFHMRRRQHAFGIALGFGIEAAGSLVVFLLRSEFGTKFDPVVRITPPIAYIIAVAVWLATFFRGEPSQPAKSWDSALTPDQMITELKRHTQAVKGILGR